MRYLSFLLLIFFHISCLAEGNGIRVSPFFGYERDNYATSGSCTSKSGGGFRFGSTIAYTIAKNLDVETGVIFSHQEHRKFFNVNSPDRLPLIDNIELRKTHFFTVPLSVGFSIPIIKHLKVGVRGGGYFGVGLGKGSSIFSSNYNFGTEGVVFDSTSFSIYDPILHQIIPYDIYPSSRYDSGLLFGGNISYRSVTLRVDYYLGLMKTIFDIATPRTLSICCAYDINL